MKVLKSVAFLAVLLSSVFIGAAQINPSVINSDRALKYADSMTTAFRDHDWNRYVAISYPGVISYYGGRKSYQSYVERTRAINHPSVNNQKAKLELTQISDNHNGELQCVVKKSASTIIDGQKALEISYLVGQSLDNGQSWKFLDVSYNSSETISHIMPDIFATLDIPQRRIMFEKEQLASIQ